VSYALRYHYKHEVPVTKVWEPGALWVSAPRALWQFEYFNNRGKNDYE